MSHDDAGAALVYLRERRGMTQAEVAAGAGCSVAQLRTYERDGDMRINTLVLILRAMGLRLVDFGRAVEVVAREGDGE